MCSISQCQARNTDNQSNKRKVAAMFEDSGSEQEAENEIKNTVDRIIEESEKADETVKVWWLMFRIVTLWHCYIKTSPWQMRSLPKLVQLKSPNAKCKVTQRAVLTHKPGCESDSQDVPEQHGGLLTMLTPGTPEQAILELSLECSQNVCQENVSPNFSYNLPEQPSKEIKF